MFVTVLLFGGRQTVTGGESTGTFVIFSMYLRELGRPDCQPVSEDGIE